MVEFILLSVMTVNDSGSYSRSLWNGRTFYDGVAERSAGSAHNANENTYVTAFTYDRGSSFA